MKFSIKDFCSKHLLKKPLMENLIFWAVSTLNWKEQTKTDHTKITIKIQKDIANINKIS